MALRTHVRQTVNDVLKGVNLKVDTLTRERAEEERFRRLVVSGHFDRPAFPTPPAFLRSDAERVLEAVAKYESCFAPLDADDDGVGYCFNNIWFTSPDAEVLYTLIREHRPKTVLEVGCGNSTRVTRQAIRDGQLDTRLIAIDPQPRRDVEGLVDEFIQQPVESGLTVERLTTLLAPGDVLFIDSSHCVKCGSDVVFLLLQVIPNLPAGVLIHVHDVFLPYDYPQDWIVDERRGWNEQYLVQAMLMFGDQFEVLWPGHYLQRTRADFATYFPHCNGRSAQSLWLRKRAEQTPE